MNTIFNINNVTKILRNLVEEEPYNPNQHGKSSVSSTISYKGVVAIIILIFYVIAAPFSKNLIFIIYMKVVYV